MRNLNERLKCLEANRREGSNLPALYAQAMAGDALDLLAYLSATKGRRFDDKKQAVYLRLADVLPD